MALLVPIRPQVSYCQVRSCHLSCCQGTVYTFSIETEFGITGDSFKDN